MKLYILVAVSISLLLAAPPSIVVVVVAQQQLANSCGVTWVDAVACQRPCPSGAPADCAAGETCFANTPVRVVVVSLGMKYIIFGGACVALVPRRHILPCRIFIVDVFVVFFAPSMYSLFSYNHFHSVLIIIIIIVNHFHVNIICKSVQVCHKPNCSAANTQYCTRRAHGIQHCRLHHRIKRSE